MVSALTPANADNLDLDGLFTRTNIFHSPSAQKKSHCVCSE